MYKSPWILFSLFGSYFEFACDLVRTGDFGSFGLDCLLFIFRTNWPFQCDRAVLHNNLYVMRIGRERLVLNNPLSDLLSHISIRNVVFLLIGGGCGLIAIPLIDFGIVRGHS